MMGYVENFFGDNRDNCCIEGVKEIFDNVVFDVYLVKMSFYRIVFEIVNVLLRIYCVVCSSVMGN